MVELAVAMTNHRARARMLSEAHFEIALAAKQPDHDN